MPSQAELSQALVQARALTDNLFDLVSPEALYERPIAERHRIIFYLGHLEAFDWNLIGRALEMPAFHSSFDRLFSFGIDPGSDHVPRDQAADWPSIEAVCDYNARVRESLGGTLADAPAQLMHVAIEHRLMHAETFAYMLHQLPFTKKMIPEFRIASSGDTPEYRMVEIPEGEAELGCPQGEGFGWDNEFDEHRVSVRAFKIGCHKVTNGQYREFVKAGAPVPHFWIHADGEWFYRGMFADIPLPLDWPVYVAYDQAQAYARWKNKALATEAQFHRAAYPDRRVDAACENVNSRNWDPEPVTASPSNAMGVSQMVGNGWEWTCTPFAPFEGFKPFLFYPGYSADFFDGQHYVLKGASPRTAEVLLRPSFRNWFRAGYPYIYATFRLVEN